MKLKLILPILLSTLLLPSCAWIAPSRQVVGTVVLTERTAGDTQHYRVAIKEGRQTEMFTNIDAIELGKFNSGTLQAQLAEAQKSREEVCVEAYGWRVPFLSIFENIKSFCKD